MAEVELEDEVYLTAPRELEVTALAAVHRNDAEAAGRREAILRLRAARTEQQFSNRAGQDEVLAELIPRRIGVLEGKGAGGLLVTDRKLIGDPAGEKKSCEVRRGIGSALKDWDQ